MPWTIGEDGGVTWVAETTDRVTPKPEPQQAYEPPAFREQHAPPLATLPWPEIAAGLTGAILVVLALRKRK